MIRKPLTLTTKLLDELKRIAKYGLVINTRRNYMRWHVEPENLKLALPTRNQIAHLMMLDLVKYEPDAGLALDWWKVQLTPKGEETVKHG